MTPLSRAILGGRRSYGTLPNTTPCQVRRCFGKRSSRTTLAISSPKPITRIRSIATFLVLCSLFINVFLLQRPRSLPHLPVPLTSQIQRWLRRWRSTRRCKSSHAACPWPFAAYLGTARKSVLNDAQMINDRCNVLENLPGVHCPVNRAL